MVIMLSHKLANSNISAGDNWNSVAYYDFNLDG